MEISRTIPDEYRVSLAAHNIRFAEAEVAPGERPILPEGSRGISDEEAVARAMISGGPLGGDRLPPEVNVAARFGLFSHDVFAKGGPGVPMQLMYQDVPAWIVTFFGPGLRIPPAGWAERAEHHEYNYVIKAATGAHLMGFT